MTPLGKWPKVTDRQAIGYALSTIASWQTWGETGGPSLSDALLLVEARLAEARAARDEGVSVRLTMTLFGVQGTGQPKWGVKLVVPKTTVNVECYGETPSEALNVLADALGPDEYSTLRWAAEHAEEAP